jgi:Fe-S-cluster containining protein
MSTLLSCPQGHHWWEPFRDSRARRPDGQSPCPRCGALVALPPPSPLPPAAPPAPARPPGRPTARAVATAELTIGGAPVKMTFDVPAGPARAQDLLPAARELVGRVIELAVLAVEAKGEKISCQAGCGACCRQLVPISEPEARQLRELVDALPEPRGSEVRARFAEALRRLDAGGLLEPLRHPERFADDELRPVGLRYFHLGVPCPFLDDESCSIHPERPVSCREYLVTSSAANCAVPTAETVHCVPLAGKVSTALNRLNEDPSARFVRWVPLVLALEWAEGHPDDPPRPGPDLVREFLQRLVEKKKV